MKKWKLDFGSETKERYEDKVRKGDEVFVI